MTLAGHKQADKKAEEENGKFSHVSLQGIAKIIDQVPLREASGSFDQTKTPIPAGQAKMGAYIQSLDIQAIITILTPGTCNQASSCNI